MTNRKLQLLIYYAQARFLGLYGRQLFHENCEARAHGPVVVSQFDRFSVYRAQPITCDVPRPILSSEVQMHLNEILAQYGAQGAIVLELEARNDFPWQEARSDLPQDEPSEIAISKHTMREFYRGMGRDMLFAGEQPDEQRLAYPLGL